MIARGNAADHACTVGHFGDNGPVVGAMRRVGRYEAPAIKQPKRSETFEQTLLSYVGMCYSVAFSLTHDPYDARDLTRDVVTQAWSFRKRADATTRIKAKLLTALRERFREQYRRPTFGLGKSAVLAGRS